MRDCLSLQIKFKPFERSSCAGFALTTSAVEHHSHVPACLCRHSTSIRGLLLQISRGRSRAARLHSQDSPLMQVILHPSPLPLLLKEAQTICCLIRQRLQQFSQLKVNLIISAPLGGSLYAALQIWTIFPEVSVIKKHLFHFQIAGAATILLAHPKKQSLHVDSASCRFVHEWIKLRPF